MKHHELNLTKSYDFVKQKRPCISPNLHFMGQLLTLEHRLQEESPNKDSLFFESPLPMDVESIPVSVSTTTTTTTPGELLPRPKLNQGLHLPLKFALNNVMKSPVKRKIHSASAPCSVDMDETMPSSAKSVKTSLTLASYNCTLMGQFYSSTDGMLYPMKTERKHLQTLSLPATPVQSPHSSSLSCRTQESSLSTTKALDISLSPCRVVSLGGHFV